MTSENFPSTESVASFSDFEARGRRKNIPIDFWSAVLRYVCVAAALHGVLSGLLISLVSLGQQSSFSISEISSAENFLEIPLLIFVCLFSSLAFAVPALIAALLVCFLTCCITRAVVWSLDINPRQLYLGGFVGGMTAYIASFPLYGMMAISMFWNDEIILWELLLSIFLIALATIMGQVAGVMGARRSRKEAGERLPLYDLPGVPKFRIKHLLLITFWFAVFLTVVKAISLFSPFFWAITGSWLVGQCLSLVAVLKYLERREKKRELVLDRST